MKIGVNTLSVVPGRVGGGETYLKNLLASLVPRLEGRERLILYCDRRNGELLPPESSRVRWCRLPVPFGSRAARLIVEHLALPPLLAAHGVSVLFSPGNAVPPLAGVRHVLALQSMHYRFVPEEMARSRVAYFRALVPISAGRARRVLCMSEDLRRSLLAVSPRSAGRTAVVHEGADLGAFSPGEGGAASDRFLLYVSSLNPFKRPDSAVRALAHLRRGGYEPPPLKLAGRPDPRDRDRVLGLARSEGVEDLIEILGVIPPGALAELYRSAAALVYPSAVETFGLPPLEAMACGCPVVASDRTSIPEVVGDAALLVDPDHTTALAEAVRRVLEEPGLRERLVRRGFANVARFSWDRAAARTLAEIRAAAR